MSSQADDALETLYHLREVWAERDGASATAIVTAVEQLIVEYELELALAGDDGGREDGLSVG